MLFCVGLMGNLKLTSSEMLLRVQVTDIVSSIQSRHLNDKVTKLRLSYGSERMKNSQIVCE